MSKLNTSCWMFVGPTLNGSARVAKARGVKLLPPVKRGDVERLVSTKSPSAVAIVDGQFHQCLSVGHAEIRSALARGWQVWGLSSMGAIRACEMNHLGMRGYGEVYDWFCRDEDFRDDEVALTHAANPPYVALSEPLIHIRVWLQELVQKHLLSEKQEKRLLTELMSMWYGDRTLSRANAMVLSVIPQHAQELDETWANFDRYRLKSHDLSNFLREQPWKVTAASRRGASDRQFARQF
jgi:hypothetical protein